jgi:hypothetical protein
MKNRIFTGWTVSRLMYLLLGLLIIIQAIVDRQYFGIPFGLYFAAMGIFAFGCAGGNCFGANCSSSYKNKSGTKEKDTIFEEIN